MDLTFINICAMKSYKIFRQNTALIVDILGRCFAGVKTGSVSLGFFSGNPEWVYM
ncbi:hypothetical protein FHW89_005589 [Mucilaginibacter sp. SG564]|nr:hypothetical protein [Mucilaginibacter sp. SG564]